MTRSLDKIGDASSIIERARAPFPASKRIYLEGEIHPEVRVPFREIGISEGVSQGATALPSARFLVYDTSGPYTDPDIAIDVSQGLQRTRSNYVISEEQKSEL